MIGSTLGLSSTHHSRAHELRSSVNAMSSGGEAVIARFFVTRIGFLRSTKRILALTATHLLVIDPVTDQEKESCELTDIKEIQLSPDLPDKGFTILVGKTPESYSCRNRAEFLAAYHGLRQRVEHGAGSGEQFRAVKLSTTRSTQSDPKQIDVTLAIRASSFDRLHPETLETLSSIPLLEVVKVQKMKDDPRGLVVYFQHQKHHRYWCDEREGLIQAMGTNLSTLLFVSLRVEEADSSWEFDALTATRDELTPVMFEMPVFKLSKSRPEPCLRMLAFTSGALLERDPTTRRTVSAIPISTVYNIVQFVDEPDKFAIECKSGRTKRYQCRPCSVGERSALVGVGFDIVPQGAEQAADGEDGAMSPGQCAPAVTLVGGHEVLSATVAREVLLCNITELCSMNKIACPWTPYDTSPGIKIGTRATTTHPQLEEALLKKVAALTTARSPAEVATVLQQFNANIPAAGFKHKDRRAVQVLFKYLEAEVELPPDVLVLVLQATQRLLASRTAFAEVARPEAKRALARVIRHVVDVSATADAAVGLAAAQLLRAMLCLNEPAQASSSGGRLENANRAAVFSADTDGARALVARCCRVVDEGGVSAHTLVGSADAQVVSVLLEALENVLHSGKKGTPERSFHELLELMDVEESGRMAAAAASDSAEPSVAGVADQADGTAPAGSTTERTATVPVRSSLFRLTRSPCFAIAKNASLLTKMLVLEQAPAVVEQLQDAARREGVLLWQLYQALDCHSRLQRRISSQLVSLLSHDNPRSSEVRSSAPHARPRLMSACSSTL